MSVSASLVWEVRTTGSDNNGGGFAGGAAVATPAAPSVAISAGGTIANATYYVVITYSDANYDTAISPETSVISSGANHTITVTAPPLASDKTWWNVYIGTASGGPYFPQGTGLSLGVNRVITTTPPTTGTQPPGVDYTQSNTPHVTIDGATITCTVFTTTTQITLVGYTVNAGDARNTINITGGTATAGVYEILGVDIVNNRWILDRAAGTSTQTVIGAMGGAMATPAKVAGVMNIIGGTVYIKYSATPYTCSTSSNVSNGRVTLSSGHFFIGYDTIRTVNNTDANRPNLQPSANNVTVISNTSGSGARVANVRITNPSSFTGCTGYTHGPGSTLVGRNIYVSNMATGFIAASSQATFDRCVADTCTTGFTGGFRAYACIAIGCGFAFSTSGSICVFCVSTGGAGPGFSAGAGIVTTYMHCVAYGKTGATGRGFSCSTADRVYNSIAYGNAQEGFYNSSYPLGSGGNSSTIINCAAGGNSAGDTNSYWMRDQVINFVTLATDPFTNAAGNNFSLNDTAGGGAACKSAGFPVSFPGISTNQFLDIGVAQAASVLGRLLLPPSMSGGT